MNRERSDKPKSVQSKTPSIALGSLSDLSPRFAFSPLNIGSEISYCTEKHVAGEGVGYFTVADGHTESNTPDLF